MQHTLEIYDQIRKTRKHRQTFKEWDQVITRETLEPQQVFYSKQRSITTFGRTLNREISTATVASSDVARGSDNVIVLDSHVLQTSAYNGDNGQTTHTFAPNHTLSVGTAQFSGDSVTLMGSTVQATDIIFDGGHAKIAVAQAINTRKESKTSGGGLFRAKKKHTEYQEIPVIQPSHLKAENTVRLKGKTAKLIGTQVSAKALVNKTTVGLEIAPATGMTIYKSESSSRGLFSGTKAKQNVGQEVMVATTLDVDKIVTLGAKLTLISTALGEQITVDDVYETASQELKSWKHIETKTTGIPAPILMIGSLALTIATAGSGASGIYAAIQGLMVGKTTASTVLAAASFKLLCSQMGANFIANGGHAEDAVKSVFSDQGMISLAAQIASAGVLDKMGISMPNTNASVIQIADYSARKVLINSGMNVAFGRESLSESLTQAGINFITDVVGILGANKIGSLYNNSEGSIGFVEHKLAHGGLGLVLGSLKGDPVAGALGGFVSEMVADVTKDDVQEIAARVIERAEKEGITRQDPQIQSLIKDELKATMNWGKVAAVVTAALAKKDVSIALDTATNAIENNFALVMGARILAEIAKPVIIRIVGGSLAVLAGKKASDAVNEYDAHPEDAEWVDEGVTTEEARTRPLTTPMPEDDLPSLGGYEGHAPSPSHEGGFQVHDGVDTSVLTSDEHEIFRLSKEDITKIYKHDRFGKFYKNKEDKLYYTKDQAVHGGSTWKVYRETGKGLEWEMDLDQFGKEMTDKHKGKVGKFIPKAELNGVNKK